MAHALYRRLRPNAPLSAESVLSEHADKDPVCAGAAEDDRDAHRLKCARVQDMHDDHRGLIGRSKV